MLGKIGTESLSTPYSYSKIASYTQPTGTSTFRSILGTIAGTALNVATGGVSGIIGSLIAGSKSGTASGIPAGSTIPSMIGSTVAGAAGMGTGATAAFDIGVGGATVGGMSAELQQYLALQQQIQAEARTFELASTILKVKHDCAMSAIRNMR